MWGRSLLPWISVQSTYRHITLFPKGTVNLTCSRVCIGERQQCYCTPRHFSFRSPLRACCSAVGFVCPGVALFVFCVVFSLHETASAQRRPEYETASQVFPRSPRNKPAQENVSAAGQERGTLQVVATCNISTRADCGWVPQRLSFSLISVTSLTKQTAPVINVDQTNRSCNQRSFKTKLVVFAVCIRKDP